MKFFPRQWFPTWLPDQYIEETLKPNVDEVIPDEKYWWEFLSITFSPLTYKAWRKLWENNHIMKNRQWMAPRGNYMRLPIAFIALVLVMLCITSSFFFLYFVYTGDISGGAVSIGFFAFVFTGIWLFNRKPKL